MSQPPPEDHRWFVDEVHPHAPSLAAYLRRSFPTVRDVDDVVQETFLRLWRVRMAQPIRAARSFLFHIARHVAVDLVRRNRNSPIDPLVDAAGLHALDHGPSAADLLDACDKIDLLGQAIASLPPRCREIIALHKIRGLPQREIAQRLGLAEKTIENHVAVGVARCEAYFRRHGIEYFLK